MKEQISPADVSNQIEETKIEEKKVGRNINEYLKAHGIEAPPVKLHIFFNAHEYAKDIEGVQKYLAEADIVFPELVGWDQTKLQVINKVSTGEMSAKAGLNKSYGFERNPYYTRLLEILHGTDKKVAFVDLPYGSPLQEKTYEEKDNYKKSGNKIFREDLSYEEAIGNMKADLLSFLGAVAEEREEYITERFGPEIKNIIENNPDLLSKDSINALMIFGFDHKKFYHELKFKDVDVTRSFATTPLTTNYLSEIYNRLKYHKNVSDELYARALLGEILVLKKGRNFTGGSPATSYEEIFLFRSFIDKFSLNEIKEIYSHVRDKDFENYLDGVLKDKGLISA